MPVVEIERATSASPADAWAFVSDMDNWAPMLTGYQRHEIVDERRSVWTVRGELGGLTRLAEFDVTIIAWEEPDHIAFSLVGRDDPCTGTGAFHITGGAREAKPSERPAAPDLWRCLRNRIARWFLGQVTTLAQERPSAPSAAVSSLLHCRLEVTAGGGSGPIMNILLGPILEAVAQDTANRIVGALDKPSS